MGFNPTVSRSIAVHGFSGVNSDGRLARINTTDDPRIVEANLSYGRDLLTRTGSASAKRTLLYNNEGRFLPGLAFEIYPKVPAFVHYDAPKRNDFIKGKAPQNPFKLLAEFKRKKERGRPGEYAFNIPLDFDYDESKVHQEAGVEVTRMKCKQGEYLHIGATEKTGELKQSTIKKVQKVFFSVAKQIAEHHEKNQS